MVGRPQPGGGLTLHPDPVEGSSVDEARRLKQMKECLDAVLLAVEKAADDLSLQPVLMRMVAREFLHTFARLQGRPLRLARARPLEAAQAMRDWLRSHAIFAGEEHALEPRDEGIHVTVDGNCAHALRCREQMSRGFPLACQRAMEYEVGLNEALEEPYWTANRRLDPARECSFDLLPLRLLVPQDLESFP